MFIMAAVKEARAETEAMAEKAAVREP